MGKESSEKQSSESTSSRFREPCRGLTNTFKSQESAAQLGAIPYASSSSLFLANPLLSTTAKHASHTCHSYLLQVGPLGMDSPQE